MIWRATYKPKPLSFSEAELLSPSDGNSQVLGTITEEKWIPVLQANAQSRKTCCQVMDTLKQWRSQQQNNLEPHHYLWPPWLRMFSKHPPRLPTLLTFQEHRMALNGLFVCSHRVLSGTTMSWSRAKAAESSLPWRELCSVPSLMVQTGIQMSNFQQNQAAFLFFKYVGPRHGACGAERQNGTLKKAGTLSVLADQPHVLVVSTHNNNF